MGCFDLNSDGLYEVHCDCQNASSTIEMHQVIKQGKLEVLSNDLEEHEQVKGSIIDVQQWLPFAAEKYCISPNVTDYVVLSTIAMYSDLPNRNNVAFPFSSLTDFNTDIGMIAYKGWRGKPSYAEHQNKDFTKAKGVIFDAVMRPLKGFKGNLWKVILLTGFDRTKDPILVNEILSGKRPGTSMGAYCEDYTCSICGASLKKGGCEHIVKGDPTYKIIDGKLACWNTHNILPFENSSVNSPAYIMATNEKNIPMFRDLSKLF